MQSIAELDAYISADGGRETFNDFPFNYGTVIHR